GIDDDTIKEALSSFSFEDQTREAVKHVEKLLKKDKKLSTKELKQRAQLQLQRKGFSFDVISAAMDQIEYENDEDTEKEALRLHAEKAFRKY
ncbi:RecX family transcriptional regulator, partial [Staphylococcus epidermidis]